MRNVNRDTQLTDPPSASPDPRHSVWTIRPEWIGWFYLLFTLQAAPLIAALWWSEHHTGTHDNIASTISVVAGGSAALVFVAATASIIELEAVMVLKTLLERHFEKKDREKREARVNAAYEKGRKDTYQQAVNEAYERGRKDALQEMNEQSARAEPPENLANNGN